MCLHVLVVGLGGDYSNLQIYYEVTKVVAVNSSGMNAK